jgi:hypothetical protein
VTPFCKLLKVSTENQAYCSLQSVEFFHIFFLILYIQLYNLKEVLYWKNVLWDGEVSKVHSYWILFDQRKHTPQPAALDYQYLNSKLSLTSNLALQYITKILL